MDYFSHKPVLIKPHEAGNYIDLRDPNDVIMLKNIIIEYMIPDIASIILSYYNLDWCWKFDKQYKVYAQQKHNPNWCEIIDGNIIQLSQPLHELHIRHIGDKENYISVGTIILEASKILIDSPYIYIFNNTIINVIHYYNKSVKKIETLCGNSHIVLQHYVHCIKNKIIYTSNIHDDYVNKLQLKSEKNEYIIKNIAIYNNTYTDDISVTCLSFSYDKCHIHSVCADEKNNVVATISQTRLTKNSHIHFYRLELDENTKLLCINIPNKSLQIQYYNDDDIILTRNLPNISPQLPTCNLPYFKTIIYRYNIKKNITYECQLKQKNFIRISKEIIVTEADCNMDLYKFFNPD